MLFDGLDDYQAGRCVDCASKRDAVFCHGCEYQASTDQYSPAMIGTADLSYLPRLEAERITAEWRTRSARHPADLSEGELFGGRKQGEMF
jgi:hypothetical protein